MSREEKHDADVWALIAELESVTKRLREAADRAAERGWLDIDKDKGENNESRERSPDQKLSGGSSDAGSGPEERL